MEHTKGKWEARAYMSPTDSWRIADKNGNTIVSMGSGKKPEANATRLVRGLEQL